MVIRKAVNRVCEKSARGRSTANRLKLPSSQESQGILIWGIVCGLVVAILAAVVLTVAPH